MVGATVAVAVAVEENMKQKYIVSENTDLPCFLISREKYDIIKQI